MILHFKLYAFSLLTSKVGNPLHNNGDLNTNLIFGKKGFLLMYVNLKMKFLIFLSIFLFNTTLSELIPKIETYKNGKVKTITYLKKENNKLIKVKIEDYFINGQLESSVQFKSNQKNGEYISYWENGKISSSGYFSNGKMNGLWNFWDSNGDIEGISGWKNDLKHGRWTAFYNSGQIKQESSFYEGKLDGIQFEYHKNGSKAMHAEWANGKKCGTWKYWDNIGTLIFEEYYVANDLIGKKIF